MLQNVLENFDDIVVTAGSGGTASGIAIANYLTGSKLKWVLNSDPNYFFAGLVLNNQKFVFELYAIRPTVSPPSLQIFFHFSHLTRCHAINVSDNAAYFYAKINEDLRTGGLDVAAEDIIDIIDGYKGRGYSLSTQDELGRY